MSAHAFSALPSGYAAWTADGHAVTVEYSLHVMEEIRAEAVAGARALSRTGMEVGGVLFGARLGGVVRIEARRPLACEHAFGPGFALSERDREALRTLLALPDTDRALSELQPVGWYRSRTRAGLEISDRDRAIFRRHFGEPWQVFLLTEPKPSGSAAARFAFHHSVSKPDAAPALTLRPAIASREQPAPAPPAPVVVEPAQAHRQSEEAPPQPRRRLPPRFWIGLLLVVAFALPFALTYFQSPSAPAPISLRALDTRGQLVISWNRASDEIRSARGGTLEIRDGPHITSLELDPPHLRNGTVVYARQSGRVDLRLVLFRTNGPPIEELASFIGPPAGFAYDGDEQRGVRDAR